MPVIAEPRRLRQEDCELQASPGYVARPYLKIKKKDPIYPPAEDVRNKQTVGNRDVQV
jgi:hypothetical protein